MEPDREARRKAVDEAPQPGSTVEEPRLGPESEIFLGARWAMRVDDFLFGPAHTFEEVLTLVLARLESADSVEP